VGGSVLAETFLLIFRLMPIAHHRVDAIDEEHAVEMVDLVLQDPRAQPARVDRDGLAVRRSCASTFTHAARVTGAKTPGIERQPSSPVDLAAALDDRGVQQRLDAAACPRRRPR
jgi:hypothetical protein